MTFEKNHEATLVQKKKKSKKINLQKGSVSFSQQILWLEGMVPIVINRQRRQDLKGEDVEKKAGVMRD